ncbi:MAG: DsrE family protein [Deltaproteobacteria bacterium]|nr:DsrE family protein [Deltaproteobacteria bacterium]
MAESETDDHLLILWTNDNRDTSINMVFMYAENSLKHGWWGEVTLLIWGATARLAAGDEEIRGHVKTLINAGVKTIACRQCADNLGIRENLEKMGVEVFYTGGFLTEWIKSGKKILTI